MAVLVGLAVLWAIVLLPDVVRRASTRRSYDTIGTFKNNLSVLERANPVHSPLTGVTGQPSNVVALVPRNSAPVGTGPAAPLNPPSSRSAGVHARPAAQRGAPQRGPSTSRPTPARPNAARPNAARTAAARSQSTAARAHRRRQDIITGVFALSLLSFLGFLSFGGPMLVVHLVVDALLVVYVGLVLAATRREKTPAVSYIEPRSTAPMYATVGNDVRRSATR